MLSIDLTIVLGPYIKSNIIQNYMRPLHYLLENACIQAQAERKVNQLLSTSTENNEVGTINKLQPGGLFLYI